MPRPARTWGSLIYLAAATALGASVLACVAYVQRDQLLVYWYVHQHVTDAGDEGETRPWLAERGALSVPVLVDQLSSPDRSVCERASELLSRFLQEHGDPTEPDDAQFSLSLASMLHARYSTFSAAGRVEAVRVAYEILKDHLDQWSPNVPTALKTAGSVVLSGLKDPHREVHEAALDRLGQTWNWKGADNVVQSLVEEWNWKCYRRARDLLRSETATVRGAAAAALAGASWNDALPELIRLLHDPDGNVLKTALRTIARTAADSLSAEQLSRLVDLAAAPDPETSRLARDILDSTMSPGRIDLLVRMRHPDVRVRAKVAESLFGVDDVNPSVWLNELSKDPSPVVRRAVVQAAARVKDDATRELLKHMATSDADEEVRKQCRTALESLPNRK